MRTLRVICCLLLTVPLNTFAQTSERDLALVASQERALPVYASFGYDVAQTHEIKPHRREIPHQSVASGFGSVLYLTLTVSAEGVVIDTKATGQYSAPGQCNTLQYWPELREEVMRWKYIPFEVNGKAVTAEVKEHLVLVPTERMPQIHITPPVIRTGSKVSIMLERRGCLGRCPMYIVTVNTEGIEFDGREFVVAVGKHMDAVDPNKVRELAKRVVANFYSMDDFYRAEMFDVPTYILSTDIDGKQKQVIDYMGTRVGMPQVIRDLENAVDEFAGTDRWVKGSEGSVQ
jgi:hypothetical protein